MQRGNEKKNIQMNLGILTGKQHLSNIGHNYGYRRFQSFKMLLFLVGTNETNFFIGNIPSSS